jgi:hypothetical protein
VAGRKLVADFRNTEITGSDLHEARTVLALGDDHRIYDTMLIAPHRNGSVAAFLDRDQFPGRLLKEPGRGGLSYQDILFRDHGLGVDDPVLVKVLVGLGTMGTGNVLFGDLDPVDLATGIAAFLAFIGPEEVRPAKAALDRGLVEDERIFDIVTFVGEDGDNEILAGGPVV